MQNNDILKIMNMDVSLAVYSLLQSFQPTTASVEGSFSILGKLLSKDKNLMVENIKQNMMLHFNSCTW